MDKGTSSSSSSSSPTSSSSSPSSSGSPPFTASSTYGQGKKGKGKGKGKEKEVIEEAVNGGEPEEEGEDEELVGALNPLATALTRRRNASQSCRSLRH
jgi:hypothetical protein